MLVVCYDVADNKRRRKLVKVLKSYGYRVQESVFHCRVLEEGEVELLVKTIKNLLNPQEDRWHIYFLCSRCSCNFLSMGVAFSEKEAENLVIC